MLPSSKILIFVCYLSYLIHQVNSQQIICQQSPDATKRVCYYSKTQHCYQFQSCQSITCIPSNQGPCVETTTNYDQQDCFKQLSIFTFNHSNIKRCTNNLRKQKQNTVQNIESIIITLLTIFVLVSVFLQLKNCMCKGNSFFQQQQQEYDQNQQSQSEEIQAQRYFNGLVEIRIAEPVQQSAIEKQKKKRRKLLKKLNQKQEETDLNLGYLSIHYQQQQQNVKEQENSDIKTQSCCICLLSTPVNCRTACGHYYHSKCLIQWLKIKQFCPCCRNQKYFPVEIFCISCNKIRDIFRMNKHSYSGYSRINDNYFHQFGSCIQCVEKGTSEKC